MSNWDYDRYERPYAEGPSKLVDAVIDQIKQQALVDDWEAVDELLRYVPRENLINFLPEEDWPKYIGK